MQRRTLNLKTGQAVLQEIEKLQKIGYQKVGNWNLSQTCDHLYKTMRVGLDGSVKPFPWILRATIGNLLLAYVLRKERMFAGAKTLKCLLPEAQTSGTDEDDNDLQIIQNLSETIQEAIERTEQLPPYPWTTNITLDKWKQLMWIHASHHLSFLLPNESNDTPVS
ncbi:MAG: DUF1569 domain-containing protein [Pirellulaceae bacterium]|nr:DUF1569 domain-containing protein [Pirellulaceae bacterium]